MLVWQWHFERQRRASNSLYSAISTSYIVLGVRIPVSTRSLMWEILCGGTRGREIGRGLFSGSQGQWTVTEQDDQAA